MPEQPSLLDVLCVGHAAWDLLFTVEGFIEEDRKVRALNLVQSGGGPAANAACLLARWGLRTTLIARVGNDAFGALIRGELDEAGVDTSRLLCLGDTPTPVSCILANQRAGTRTVVNHRRDPQALPDAFALPNHAPRAILCDGHEPVMSRRALKRFGGAVSILDAGSFREDTHHLASCVDHAIVSSDFAREATGIHPIDDSSAEHCLRGLSKRYPSRVAITRGAHGISAMDDARRTYHLRPPAVTAVDSTAAGDIFHGAFVWALLQGHEYRAALVVAMRTAALSVTRPGGRQSIPTRHEALSFAPEWEGRLPAQP